MGSRITLVCQWLSCLPSKACASWLLASNWRGHPPELWVYYDMHTMYLVTVQVYTAGRRTAIPASYDDDVCPSWNWTEKANVYYYICVYITLCTLHVTEEQQWKFEPHRILLCWGTCKIPIWLKIALHHIPECYCGNTQPHDSAVSHDTTENNELSIVMCYIRYWTILSVGMRIAITYATTSRSMLI